MNFDLPFVNACLNFLSSVFLVLGCVAIKKKKINTHKNFMITAFLSSAVFLACYLYYHYTAGHFIFKGEGLQKTVYLIILLPHILLAIVMVPMIIITFYYAFKSDWNDAENVYVAKHRKLAKKTLPIWLYVSVSGVVLYLYIYVIFPGKLEKEKDLTTPSIEEIN
jgi:putative membrane protein